MLGTASFKVWELVVPGHGNLWFPRWEPSGPTCGNWNFLAKVTNGSQVGKLVPAAGNRQLLAMVTYGSQVKKGKFQASEPAVPCLGAIFCSQVANRQIQP